MKKNLGKISGVIVFIILLAVQAHAAATGTCTVSESQLASGPIYKITWNCTSDGSGTFTATGFASTKKVTGWLYDVTFKPGGTAPNGGSFTMIKSSNSGDALQGGGASIMGAVGNDAVSAKTGWMENSTLQPVITGNTTASATFSLYGYIWIQK